MSRPDAHEKCSAGRWPFARQGPSEMGFSIPSIGPVRWIYLEIVVREWEPVSTQGVCGSIIPPRLSRSSPSTLLSAVFRSSHRIFCQMCGYSQPHREELGLTV